MYVQDRTNKEKKARDRALWLCHEADEFIKTQHLDEAEAKFNGARDALKNIVGGNDQIMARIKAGRLCGRVARVGGEGKNDA